MTLSDYLADATQKASADLVEAFLRLPEDRRAWTPGDQARTALDQMAEVALLNGYTAQTLQTHQVAPGIVDNFARAKSDLAAQGWDTLYARLQDSAAQVCAAIRAVPEADFLTELVLPWGPMSVMRLMAIPSWNMTYHLGQMNYIASLPG